jgi:hypothetical protein
MVIQSLRSSGALTHRLTKHLSDLLGSYLGNSLYNVITLCIERIERKYVPAVMSHCLLQRSQLWKHVPVFSVMLSEPYYKQKGGHEFVHSAFVSLMLGTVLFI